MDIFKLFLFAPSTHTHTVIQNRKPKHKMMDIDGEEAMLHRLRSRAAELLLREEWSEAIEAYSQFISFCEEIDSDIKLQKPLCLAFSNRAEARFRARDFTAALADCEEALKIDSAHFKTLLCKGKILLHLNRYGTALECFRLANLDSQESSNFEPLNEYLERCKKLESLSKTGSFDVSDWILGGFSGKMPELAEYIGGVEIKKSDISGRGLFATKNIESGTLLLVTKAVAIERGILPQEEDPDENAQLVMWKNLVDKVVESARKCSKTHCLIRALSDGESEDDVPEIGLFSHEAEEAMFPRMDLDVDKILRILDVNSFVESSTSSKVLGKNSHYHGVGLWLLPSLINHSCEPNVRRLHIGDHVAIHACRDVKAGEELAFAYFDNLQPSSVRQEMSRNWGFACSCKRCKFEGSMIFNNQEIRDLEMMVGAKGVDKGTIVYRLEEGMKRWNVRGKAKGILRASFWGAYEAVFASEKMVGRWGRRLPRLEVVVDSVVDVVGSDERVGRVLITGLLILKRNGNGSYGMVEREKAMKMGRGIFGKVMKRQALRSLLQIFVHQQI